VDVAERSYSDRLHQGRAAACRDPHETITQVAGLIQSLEPVP
jgi:hypothetical protein